MGIHSRGKAARAEALAKAREQEAAAAQRLRFEQEQAEQNAEREAREAKIAAMKERLKMSGVKKSEPKNARIEKLFVKLQVAHAHGRVATHRARVVFSR